MRFFNDPDRIPQSYGVRIALGLIIYFMVMYTIGLAHQVELRLLNLLILITGVYFALIKFKETHDDRLNYFRALVTGVYSGHWCRFIRRLSFYVYDIG